MADGRGTIARVPGDIRFYSERGDGRGRNELGRILMAVRATLRAEGDGAR